MIDFLKILAWFLICLCVVILAGRVYGLQERVEQLEKVVKIEEQAVKWELQTFKSHDYCEAMEVKNGRR